MKKHYAEDGWRASIDSVEIERESESSFWVDGNCRRKKTSNTALFDSYAEAKAFLVERHLQRVNQAKYQLSQKEKELKIVESF